MEGKDFAMWIFAALMVLSPMAAAATMHGYRGEAVAGANGAAPAAPASTVPGTPAPKP